MGGPQAGTNNGYLFPGRTGGKGGPYTLDCQHRPPPLLALLQHPRGRAPPSLGLGWSVTQPALPQAPPPESIWGRGLWAEQEVAMRTNVWRWSQQQ